MKSMKFHQWRKSMLRFLPIRNLLFGFNILIASYASFDQFYEIFLTFLIENQCLFLFASIIIPPDGSRILLFVIIFKSFLVTRILNRWCNLCFLNMYLIVLRSSTAYLLNKFNEIIKAFLQILCIMPLHIQGLIMCSEWCCLFTN